MYPDRDTLSNVLHSGYIAACDQSMLERGVREGGKNTARSCHWLPVFFFVNEHNNTMKPPAKKQRDTDNVRKVLCKPVIQWFWELNLCSYKYRVDCFDSLCLSVFFCCCWSTLEWKSRNITAHLMSGPSGNQLLLFSRPAVSRDELTLTV